MEIKGWEEIAQETYNKLLIQHRATITFGDPYKVVYIAKTAGLEKLKQTEDERTTTETSETGMETDSSRAEDSEAQH